MKHVVALSRIELLILLSIGSDVCHGYEIMQRVEVLPEGGKKLGAGTLYVAIKRLVTNGFLTEDFEQQSARRRYYKVSDTGKQAVSDKLASYQSVVLLAAQKGWAM